MLEFVVEKDGTISTINVLRSVCEALDKESIRVVRAMPKWIPAQDEGQPCRSYYQLPFTYMMQ
jgi:Gram-negative bacterial tonB protein.